MEKQEVYERAPEGRAWLFTASFGERGHLYIVAKERVERMEGMSARTDARVAQFRPSKVFRMRDILYVALPLNEREWDEERYVDNAWWGSCQEMDEQGAVNAAKKRAFVERFN